MASDIGAANASAILKASQRKPGEFKIRNDAAVNIRGTIDQLGAQAARQQMIGSAVNRLNGVAQGIIDPSNDWERVGGFLQITGQPFTLSIGDKGEIQVQAQAESDLADFNPRQQKMIRDAIERMNELVQQVDFEDKKTELRGELAFAMLRVEEMKRFSPAEEFWERQFQSLEAAGRPVKIALDADGAVTALDQLTHDFSEIEDLDDRRTLLNARNELQDILSGQRAATKGWHFTALGNKSSGEDYFLDLDENGAVTISRNNIGTVIPEFLQPDPDGPQTEAAWEEEALALYENRRGFQFAFSPDGQSLVVKENTFQTLTQGVDIQAGQERIRAALVSLLA
ncbi:MAG: hypothetical protein RIB45_09025 [Marivibrio sp.]|uniref:hypothetical protein n=1 Tax=Marivibrio sp. TaxID=2039719 RepID=UPI0032EDC05A